MTSAYSFIEIGTCDFDTVSERASEEVLARSVAIEPVRTFLDKLPRSKAGTDCKLQLAVVGDNDQAATCTMQPVWYMSAEQCRRLNAPEWVRGCARLGRYPHIELLGWLAQQGLYDQQDSLIQCDHVPVVTGAELWSSQWLNVASCEFLKIDTEGYDMPIFESIYRSSNIVCPRDNDLNKPNTNRKSR